MTKDTDAIAAVRKLDELAEVAAFQLVRGPLYDLPVDAIAEIASTAMPHLPGVSRREAERDFVAELCRAVACRIADVAERDEIVAERVVVFANGMAEHFPPDVVLH